MLTTADHLMFVSFMFIIASPLLIIRRTRRFAVSLSHLGNPNAGNPVSRIYPTPLLCALSLYQSDREALHTCPEHHWNNYIVVPARQHSLRETRHGAAGGSISRAG
jgi:hypothetical protein